MALKASVPAFPVADIEQAAAFYQSKLSFSLAYQEEDFAIVSRDAVELHLWRCGDTSWKKRWRDRPIISGAESFLKGTASCRMACDEIEELSAACREAKIVHPNGKLSIKPWGTIEFAVLDLDGNLITFFAPKGLT